MKQDEAVKAILQRWMTLWPGLSSSVPYVFDNDVLDDRASYARVSITSLEEHQQTYGAEGNRKFLGSGLIDVKLYGPGNAGRKGLDLLAEYVRQIYQAVRFGLAGGEEGVITYATSAQEVRPESDAASWVLLLSTPFEYVDVR